MSKPILWEQSSPLMNTLRNVNDDIPGMGGYTLIDLDGYVKHESKKMFCEHKKSSTSILSWSTYDALFDLHQHYKNDPDFWGVHLVRYDRHWDYLSDQVIVYKPEERIWKVDKKAVFNIDGVVNIGFQDFISFKRFHLRFPSIYDKNRGRYISLFDRPKKEYMKLVYKR